ncbi:MAG TPA: ATP-binding protein [Thermoanaerobaculia bacterium]|jgi:PAS domain S-box-containing protein|nr:ATP-binding protein [Thermoanaerobaculia bacterium]
MQIGAEVLYKALFETTPDGIMIVDDAGTYVDLNPSMCRMLRGTPEQLVGRHFRDFIPPDHLEAAIAEFQQLKGDGALAVQFPIRALDGTETTLEWRSRANFVPGLHFCIARDLSALRHSEERYRAFLTTTSEAIWRFELEQPVPTSLPPEEQIDLFYRHGYLAECNDAMAAMYGFASREELTGARLGDLLLPEEPANHEYLRAFIESGYRLADAESTEVDRDGNIKYFANNLIGIIENDAVVRAWGTQRDVTDRRRSDEDKAGLLATASFVAQAAEVLSSSLDYDQTLAAIAAIAVPQFSDWCFVDVVDEQGAVRRLVIKHSDERQIALAEEAERKYPTLGDPAYGPPRVIRSGRPEATDIDDALLTRLARSEEHLDILRRLGFCSAVIVPLIARGRTLGALTFVNAESGRRFDEAARRTANDLARRAAMAADNARLYQHLESANRAKDDFLATLSHELRTPMTATLGWASMLRMGGLAEETVRTAVETIAQSTAAQSRLIDDILDVSRIVTGKMQISLQPVRLADPILAALETVRSAADAKQIMIDVELQAEGARVSGDPARLQQVLWNLLSNAVKFTPRGGRVRVTLDQPQPGTARVTVGDDGEGIAPEFLPFVFERFRQGETGMNRRHSGLGLGLSIARNLVELHGGRMTAASDWPGRGATFTILLPLLTPAREVPPPDAARRATPALLREVRVLIVEDEDATRTMLGVALRQFGAMVVAVATAEEALRALGTGTFDVVVSDIGLPGEDGYSLIRRIRQGGDGTSSIGAIALTAYAASNDRDRALAAGFHAYLSKPVEPAALAAEVRRVAGRR